MQEAINELTSQIRGMKDYLPRMVQKIGYRSVQKFLKDFKVFQTEYSQYRTAIEKWKNETGKEPESHGISYILGEDGQYYPDLYLPEETEYPIGKYGMLRKTYLKNYF